MVGADGTVVVTGTDGRSFVVHPDGELRTVTRLGVAFAAGDRLYATSYGQDKGPLLMSEVPRRHLAGNPAARDGVT